MDFPLSFYPLIAELAIFCVADYADQFMTDYMVKRYGPQIEENSNIRKMYQTGNFRGNTVTRASVFIVYAILGVMVLSLLPFAIYGFLLGLVVPMFALTNAVRGSLIFLRARRC